MESSLRWPLLIVALLALTSLSPMALQAGVVPTVTMDGYVTDGAGNGIVSQGVEIYDLAGEKITSANTADGGYYSFDLQPGQYRVGTTARVVGGLAYLPITPIPVEVAIGTGFRQDLTVSVVDLDVTVTGLVTDGGSSPGAGLRVTLTHETGLSRSTSIGGSGSYSLSAFGGAWSMVITRSSTELLRGDLTLATPGSITSADLDHADLVPGTLVIEIEDLEGNRTTVVPVNITGQTVTLAVAPAVGETAYATYAAIDPADRFTYTLNNSRTDDTTLVVMTMDQVDRGNATIPGIVAVDSGNHTLSLSLFEGSVETPWPEQEFVNQTLVDQNNTNVSVDLGVTIAPGSWAIWNAGVANTSITENITVNEATGVVDMTLAGFNASTLDINISFTRLNWVLDPVTNVVQVLSPITGLADTTQVNATWDDLAYAQPLTTFAPAVINVDPASVNITGANGTWNLSDAEVRFTPAIPLGAIVTIDLATNRTTYPNETLIGASLSLVFDFELSAGAVLSGTVEDGANATVGGAHLTIIETGNGTVVVDRDLSARSYRAAVTAGRDHLVVVSHPDRAPFYLFNNATTNGTHDARADLIALTGPIANSTFLYRFSDPGNLTLTKTLVLAPTLPIPDLELAGLASPRLQIDLLYGDGDLVLQATEIAAFVADYVTQAADPLTTEGFLNIDGIRFAVDPASATVSLVDGAGNDATWDDPAPLTLTLVVDLSVIEPLDGGDRLLLDLTISKDPIATNVTHIIDLPPGYERTNTNAGVTRGVPVSGSTQVTIDPTTTSSPGKVRLELELTADPVARLSVEGGAEDPRLGKAGIRVVAAGENVTFSGADSSDPVGSIVTYAFDLDGDGTFEQSGPDTSLIHIFTVPGDYNVSLRVTDSSGGTDDDWVTIRVDDDSPVIIVSIDGIVITGDVFSVDQRADFTINIDASTDAHSENLRGDALITWGDGPGAQTIEADQLWRNYTHSYPSAGTVNLTVTLADRVGHESNRTLTVSVVDTEPPQAIWSWTNTGGIAGGQVLVGQEATLSASTSTDNLGGANLTFAWTVEDPNGTEVKATGVDLTQGFPSAGRWTIGVTATDTAGNSAAYVGFLTVDPTPAPELVVISFRLSDPTPDHGQRVSVVADIANEGTAGTTDGLVEFLIDGKVVSSEAKIVLEPGAQREIRWTFTAKSGQTEISIRVTPGDSDTSTRTAEISVEKSFTQRWFWALITIAIIGVLLLGVFLYQTFFKKQKTGRSKRRRKVD